MGSHTEPNDRTLKVVEMCFDCCVINFVISSSCTRRCKSGCTISIRRTRNVTSRKGVICAAELEKNVFLRKDNNGWNALKLCGMTKMSPCMTLFGNRINFYGGPRRITPQILCETSTRSDSLKMKIFWVYKIYRKLGLRIHGFQYCKQRNTIGKLKMGIGWKRPQQYLGMIQ